MAEGKKCPQCGEAVEDLRVTCPNCGYEYSGDDYSNTEEGNEFIAGAAMDDKGNEITDSEAGGAGPGDEADEAPGS